MTILPITSRPDIPVFLISYLLVEIQAVKPLFPIGDRLLVAKHALLFVSCTRTQPWFERNISSLSLV
jgi:hypothetical protein